MFFFFYEMETSRTIIKVLTNRQLDAQPTLFINFGHVESAKRNNLTRFNHVPY